MIDVTTPEDFMVDGNLFRCVYADGAGECLRDTTFIVERHGCEDFEVDLRGYHDRGSLTMTHEQSLGGQGYQYADEPCKIYFVKNDVILSEEDKFELSLKHGWTW